MRKSKNIFLLLLIILFLFGCSKKTESNKTTTKTNSNTDSVITTDSNTKTNNNEDVYYDIVFVDYDNTVLYQTRVKEGETPTYSMSNPTRSNDSDYSYEFSGWVPSISSASSNATYTATYTRTALPYTISFNLDGGTSTDTIKTIKTDKLDKTLFSFNVKKSGYAFKGWSYNNQIIFDEKGELINTPVMSSNMTFKAEFKQAVTLTINYSLYNPKTNELNETYDTVQSDFGNISKTKEYNWNTYVDLFANLNEGYTFIGWYNEGTVLSNETDYKYMMWEEDFTIEARIKYTIYDLNVYSNDSSLGQVMIKEGNSQTFYNSQTKEEYYTEKVTIAAYTKTDTRFLGWYDSNNNLVSTNAIYTFNMLNSNVPYEAKWNSFNITYDLDGGTNNSSNPATYNVDMDNITLLDPTKEGYTFVGWYYNDELITMINTKNACHMNLIAHWTYYTLTTIWQDNYAGAMLLYNNTKVTAGNSVTITAITYTGYIFDGWYLNNNKVSINSTYTFNMPNSNVVYEARAFLDEVYKDLEPFIFEITDTDVIITGIKDKNVTGIVVPNYVTRINNYAFSGCSSLVSISLPFVGDKVHSESDAYQYPFGYIFGSTSYTGGTSAKQYYYESTSSITNTIYIIPKSLKEVIITGSSYIQYGAFDACSALVSITLPNSVTNIGSVAFRGCVGLESIIIPNNVISIGDDAFKSCTCEILYGDNPTIKSIESYAFRGYLGTNITIPKSITSLGYKAFKDCNNLENVYYDGTIEKWCKISFKTDNYANPMYYASRFYILDEYGDCVYNNKTYSLLTEIIIPDTIDKIGYSQFYGFNCVSSIIIPSSVKTMSAYSITGFNLANVYYNGTILDWCTMSFTNYDAHPLIQGYNLYFMDEYGDIVHNDNTYIIYSDITELIVPNYITHIDSYQFYGFDGLTNIFIPNSVTSIGGSAFRGCSSLVSITLPFIGDKLYTMTDKFQFPLGYIFGKTSYSGGESTQQYYNWYNSDTDTLYTTNDSFYIPKTLREVIITGGSFIQYGSFENCSNLISIIIPSSVTSIGDEAFNGCSSLTSIVIPNSVISIGKKVFAGCTSLETLTLPFVGDKAHKSTDTYQYPLGYIFGHSGMSSDSIASIRQYYYGSSTSSTTYDSYLVPKSLREVIITGSSYIQYGAFYGFSFLTSISIPKSVSKIENAAFYNCSSLLNVYYAGTQIDWQNITIGTGNTSFINATIYYYSENEPSESGNYWHYNDNNEIVIW